MGMSLDNGGHLTHGSPANISGKYFNFVPYGVNDDGFIDLDAFAKQVNKVKPKLIVAGASAYPRAIDFKTMADIAHANGAMFMVDMAHIAGLVAAGLHQNPVPYADVVTTTTHKTLRGPRGGLILCNNPYLIKSLIQQYSQAHRAARSCTLSPARLYASERLSSLSSRNISRE